MDGQILGYDSETGEGAIRTDDGDRYTFKTDDWKGQRPPKAGDKVDFVVEETTATEIYLVKGSFSAPDLSGLGDKLGDADSRAEMVAAVKSNATVELFLTKPHVAGAGLIILGWVLAGHLLLITTVGDLFDAMGQINEAARFLGGDTGIGLFRSIGVLSLLLFYLIPIFAGWLIFKSIGNGETAKDKRRGAIAGLVLPIAVPIIASIFIFIGLPGQMRSAMMEGAARAKGSGLSLWDLIDVDFAWLLMIAGGVLIVLQLMGIVKSFGKPTGQD
ncbi:MAG: hypothetical protein AAGF20_08245 [Pseudomonadota bacterium]